MPRKHIKKDDHTQCGLLITPKLQKLLAADRQSVTCGACELVSRPKVAPPPKVEPPADWVPGSELEGEGGAEGASGEGEPAKSIEA